MHHAARVAHTIMLCCHMQDCTAATDLGNHKAAIKMVQMQGGVFGAVADSAALIAATTRKQRTAHANGSGSVANGAS